jgi:hypothetical protein
MFHVDPEYFHMFNGINIAIGNLAVDYIYHPGTIIQFIYAISAHIVNLILPGSTIPQKMIDNPEIFIHGASIFFNSVVAFILFMGSYVVLKKTSNILLSIMLQLTPLTSYQILLMTGRLIPEGAMIIPITILVFTIILFINDNPKKNNKRTNKFLLVFALIGGLGISCKFSYLPFLLIPLFIINNNKNRLKYLVYTFFAIIILAYPAFIHLSKTYDWLSNMTIHSGKWGGGHTGFINTKEIIPRLKLLYGIDNFFWGIMTAGLFTALLKTIVNMFSEKHTFDLNTRAILAVVVSVFIFTLMVVKHFTLHYFFPALLFKTLVFVLTIRVIQQFIKPAFWRKIIVLPAFLVLLFLVSTQMSLLQNNLAKRRKVVAHYENRYIQLKKYMKYDQVLILTQKYRGSPFVQTGLAGGLLMSGKLKKKYTKILKEHFPRTLMYYDWLNKYPGWQHKFYFWGKAESPENMITTKEGVYIFIAEGKNNALNSILKRLRDSFNNYKIEVNKIYQFKNPREAFYHVSFKKAKTDNNDNSDS